MDGRDDALDDEAFAAEEERRHEAARNHPLSQAADRYWRDTDQWLEAHAPLFEAKEQELNARVRMDPDSSEPDIEAAGILDAVEVIRWYQYFIAAKLYRAVHRDPELEEELAEFPRDSDGSAKIALIAMDRSLGAWGFLRETLGDERDSILDLLVQLDRLRRGTEAAFPEARAFVRPGFDEAVPPPAPEG